MPRADLVAHVKAIQEKQHRDIDKRCAADPMYWLRNHTATYDPKAVALGLEPTRPFPDWEYFDWLMYFLRQRNKVQAIPKSREMLTSWVVAGYAAHVAQWTPYAQVLCQTEKEDKALKLIGYSKALYDQQPEWLRKMHPLRGNYIKSRPGKDKELEIHFANGAEIIGIASGANQIPSYHPTLVILDECALWPEAELSFQLALPVAMQIILVSTARPGWFEAEAGGSPGPFGDPENIDEKATLELIESMRGICPSRPLEPPTETERKGQGSEAPA